MHTKKGEAVSERPNEKRKSSRWLAAALIAGFGFLWFAVGMPPNPILERARRIQAGMTTDQVAEILGRPWMRSEDARNSAGLTVRTEYFLGESLPERVIDEITAEFGRTRRKYPKDQFPVVVRYDVNDQVDFVEIKPEVAR